MEFFFGVGRGLSIMFLTFLRVNQQLQLSMAVSRLRRF
jgi:hypothetical protein